MKLYQATATVTVYFLVESEGTAGKDSDLKYEAKESVLDEIENNELNDVNSVITFKEIDSLDQVSELHHHALPWYSAGYVPEDITVSKFLEDQTRLAGSRA